RRHHLHGGRDLLRRLDAVDPVLEVLEARHAGSFRALTVIGSDRWVWRPSRHAKVFTKLSMKALSLASVASLISFSSRIAARMSPCLARTSESISCSKRVTSSTLMPSR